MSGSTAHDPASARASAAVDPSPATERDLAATLHEVSNALTVVLGWVERAQASVGSGSAASEALAIAVARARQAQFLVRADLAVASPASRPAPDRDAVAELRHVVADAARGLRPQADRASVSIVTSLGDLGAASVPTPERVLGVLTNLLLNAIAHAPAGSSVRVDAARVGSSAVIAVSDEGPGVPAARHATLFSDGVSTREGGAGIGLRHSAAITASAGGSLRLVPSARGARFELTWPCVPPPAPASGAGPRTTPASFLRGARVLVLEDDDAVTGLLDLALGSRGAVVTRASRYAELRDALASGPFDAALVDVSPIADDVAGALREIRAASPDVRVVVISGSADDLPPSFEGPRPAWVRKPFEVGEVLRALQ